MNDFKLLEQVQQHALLYDKSLEDYKDIMKKKNTWDLIARNLKATSENCQKRFRVLRDKYSRIKRREKNGVVVEDLTPPPLLKRMTFLAPHIVPRCSSGAYYNFEKEERSEKEAEKPATIGMILIPSKDLTIKNSVSSSSSTVTTNLASCSETPSSHSNKRKLSADDSLTEELTETTQLSKDYKSQSSNEAFGKVVADYLDQITDKRKLSTARLKILTLLHDIVYDDIW